MKWRNWNKVLMEEAGKEGSSGGGTSDPDNGDNGGKGPGDPPPKDKPDNLDDDGKKGKTDEVDPGDTLDELPAWAQKEIKGLRSESAKHRTDNKTLRGDFDTLKKGLAKALGLGEDDDIKPEDKIADLNGQNDNLNFQNAILSTAVQNGIGENQLEYFSFLMEKEVNALGDDEELSEEKLAGIIQKTKAMGGSSSNSSVDDKGDGSSKNPESNGDTTLEEFTNMNMLEKSKLYREKPDVYNRLVSQAKVKGVLI